MNQPKTYDIRTIDDLAKVATSDNLDNLITDLHGWLLCVIIARQITQADGADFDGAATWTNFHWIDDGKHDIQITVEPKP
jgi:hypothetical protein